ncbi:MAG: hydrogenase iron-sulfur subunit [Peptococcaceae bacterium]|nr:hydrogenase iron-sulfur subunit [Peptococcaceae bacterium]
MSTELKFKPRLLGIICNWCCYGGADLAGVSRFQYPPYIKLMRVMCSGRVDMKHIFRAFSQGADGVFVGGCHLNDCHYITNGNYDALSMIQLCRKILKHIGVNPKRLRIEWVSAGEGIRFANIMNEFSVKMEKLGPLAGGGGIDEDELKSKLEEVTRLIPYIKLAKKEKLRFHSPDEEKYEDLFTSEEIDSLFRDVPSYYIAPSKCQACMTCAKRCHAGAILSIRNQIHVIDQEKCIKCGTCLECCPTRFGAVTKISGEPVPPPIPEAERTIVKNTEENMKELPLLCK